MSDICREETKKEEMCGDERNNSGADDGGDMAKVEKGVEEITSEMVLMLAVLG